MTSEPRIPIGISRIGLLASCAAVETASKPIKAKNTTAAPRAIPDQPSIPTAAWGGMKAPRGLLAATQFAVLKAGRVQTTNSAITTSLTATMKLLNRAVSRMPATRSAVMTMTIATAGTLRMAPVDDQAGVAASEV